MNKIITEDDFKRELNTLIMLSNYIDSEINDDEREVLLYAKKQLDAGKYPDTVAKDLKKELANLGLEFHLSKKVCELLMELVPLQGYVKLKK